MWRDFNLNFVYSNSMYPSSSQIGHEGKYAIKTFVTLFKGPNPSYLVLTFAGNCLSSNWDMTQMWIYRVMTLKVKVICEGQQYFAKISRNLPMSIHVKFHWDPISSFSGNFTHNFSKSGQEKEETKTVGETVWRTLTFCDTNYAMKKWCKSDHT